MQASCVQYLFSLYQQTQAKYCSCENALAILVRYFDNKFKCLFRDLVGLEYNGLYAITVIGNNMHEFKEL